MQNSSIYMDYAATTPVAEEVLQKMMPYLTSDFGNPSSIHPAGERARIAVEKAREEAARLIHADTDEIYFTSGGTESDNWALKGIADACGKAGAQIITTEIEHHAVLNTCHYLEKHGFRVTFVEPDCEGRISPEAVEREICPDTVCISVMCANNEIGTIEPIREIGAAAHRHGVFFHTDAVQAFGHIPVDVHRDNIDLLSASSHKINGPKGTGLLFVRRGTVLAPLLHGGRQERGRRAGTENTPGIVGFGEACRIAGERMEKNSGELRRKCRYFYQNLIRNIPHIVLNGPEIGDHRLPNNLNITFQGVDGEMLLMRAAEKGVFCSAGSACDSGSVLPSHVLLAVGKSYADAGSSLRFTLGPETGIPDIDCAVEVLKEEAGKIREETAAV